MGFLRWSACLLLLLLALLSPPAIFAEPCHKQSPSILQGKVICQDCQRLAFGSGTTQTSQIPIQGAFVALKCYNNAKKVVKFVVAKTSKLGLFSFELNGYTRTFTSCKAMLLSSPIKRCNLKTNLNEGIVGATPLFKKQEISSTRVFFAGPFAFKPYYCK